MKPRTEVTEQELRDFVAAYPRDLYVDVCGIGDPPLVTYNDFTLGSWPESVVASYLREWFDEPAHAFRIVKDVPQ
jgi:hypothetical protein